MYGHPLLVKQWAKIMKPDATPAQIEQARIMRAAKIAKRIFMQRQNDLFSPSAPAEKNLPDGSRKVSTFA
ncbi:hypothetical protein [Thiobacillus denitrificans]|jgi:hypothetical protein|uniref:hypothetical protein n=1 Tax=Thiobacillus denitrificans TaxID=36861 RepID=UPI00036922DF|nr:hypothetical protein [Thiobacillus denitrificans]